VSFYTSCVTTDVLTTTPGTGFDREVYIGTPLCIQVVTPTLMEEKLVHAMSVIDSALKTSERVGAKL
jgi:amidase